VNVHRASQLAQHERHDGAQAKRLLGDRFGVTVIHAGEALLAQSRELVGMVKQATERPCERGGGRAVGEQGEQFVANLLLVHRLPTLLVRALEHREDVVRLFSLGGGATQANLVDHGVLDGPHHTPQPCAVR
jgi:hypothetical protein